MNLNAKFLIQWDNASKRYPYRVLTISGTCLAYFRNQKDAEAFCG
jgi:hypothetical protein